MASPIAEALLPGCLPTTLVLKSAGSAAAIARLLADVKIVHQMAPRSAHGQLRAAAFCRTSARGHLRHILGVCARTKVCRIQTSRRVAGVERFLPLLTRPIIKDKDSASGERVVSHWVASGVACVRPIGPTAGSPIPRSNDIFQPSHSGTLRRLLRLERVACRLPTPVVHVTPAARPLFSVTSVDRTQRLVSVPFHVGRANNPRFPESRVVRLAQAFAKSDVVASINGATLIGHKVTCSRIEPVGA